jgi:hypothetical protein
MGGKMVYFASDGGATMTGKAMELAVKTQNERIFLLLLFFLDGTTVQCGLSPP